MQVYDFEYDGIRLSDLGYNICNFNGKDLETISNGSQITWNTVSILNGIKYEQVSTSYDECLTSTFQICKMGCNGMEDLEISVYEFRQLMRWLNRKQFHRFRFMDDEYCGLNFNGSFNVSRIEYFDTLVGLELELQTDAPFARLEEQEINIHIEEENGEYRLVDMSDEEGFLYPYTEITLNASGDLTIYNDAEDRETKIANCTRGEVIILDSPIIQTSDETHAIQNDFNWNFFRIANAVHNRENNLTVSLPCDIKIQYAPIAKIGLL